MNGLPTHPDKEWIASVSLMQTSQPDNPLEGIWTDHIPDEIHVFPHQVPHEFFFMCFGNMLHVLHVVRGPESQFNDYWPYFQIAATFYFGGYSRGSL